MTHKQTTRETVLETSDDINQLIFSFWYIWYLQYTMINSLYTTTKNL